MAGSEYGLLRMGSGGTGTKNRVSITPEPNSQYGEYTRRSLVKNFHAHEKEYWHRQQQEQLAQLNGMYQSYKQTSRKGNKADREVTATWTPRPYACHSPSSLGAEEDGVSQHESRVRTPTQASNLGSIYRNCSSNTPDALQSPRVNSPFDDEDLLKEALVAARNVMEDEQLMCTAKSVSGISIFSDSDARSSVQNFSRDEFMGVVSGLQWEEDSFYGVDTSRSNCSEVKAHKNMYRDTGIESHRGQGQDPDRYDSYHQQLYMASNRKIRGGSNTQPGGTDLRRSVHGLSQQSPPATPKKMGSRTTQGKKPAHINSQATHRQAAKSAQPRAVGHSTTMASRTTMVTRQEPVSHSKSLKPQPTSAAQKGSTPFGPARRIVSGKSMKCSPGSGPVPYNKGGVTPFGPAQRIPDPRANMGGLARTPREEGASACKPRVPLSQQRVGGAGSGNGKARGPPSYTNIRR